MKHTTSLRALLAAGAATALLLTGCGDGDDDAAGAPAGGQRPGVQQIDDGEPTDSPVLPGGDGTGEDEQPAETEGAGATGATDGPDAEETEGAASAEVDLSAFPLGAGWPEEAAFPEYDGLELPVAELTYPFADSTCGSPAPTPATTDVLRAQFTDVEAYSSRELFVFADADAAVAHVSALDDFYAGDACTTQDAVGGEATFTLFRVDTDAGGQSFAIGRGAEYEGEPQIGESVLHVVRVGRSVLLDHSTGEGLLTSAADTRDRAAFMTERSAGVIDAQCAFTAAGC